jgi:putative oxidoreductase
MDKALASFATYALALLRIIAGVLFFAHSGQKVFGWFGGQPVPIGSLLGVAGIIEIVLGLLITIDLLTSHAAFVASGEMAVAYFTSHYPKSFWPLENAGEPAVFLYMATQGSGIWSVDAARADRNLYNEASAQPQPKFRISRAMRRRSPNSGANSKHEIRSPKQYQNKQSSNLPANLDPDLSFGF